MTGFFIKGRDDGIFVPVIVIVPVLDWVVVNDVFEGLIDGTRIVFFDYYKHGCLGIIDHNIKIFEDVGQRKRGHKRSNKVEYEF